MMRMKFVLTAVILYALGNGLPAQQSSPSLFALDVVREALKENGVDVQSETEQIPVRSARRVLSTHLDARLLNAAAIVSAQNFHLQGSKRKEQLGIIVLRYASASVSEHMEINLKPLRSTFKNAEIYTHFSVTPLDTLLVIAYSENSGDVRMVRALDSLPAAFVAAPASQNRTWNKPSANATAK